MASAHIHIPNPSIRSVELNAPLPGYAPEDTPQVQLHLGGHRDHILVTWSSFRSAERYAMDLFSRLKAAQYEAALLRRTDQP